ncbi:SAM-dependent methyltransferase [Thermocatellispora tengchongensis]|uniref:SAM-dependent methyltransferase n=1 Tax=Thermocatellispora tengchongensis TaxID=1073253 RepID=A0A840P296_9ACTN|nr:class I SAM-dependent methyltransferase [Thermocatellispora tengchongensis]MBB5133808.1 SAM-dependent methyltransferase [Thermocatellispora tengchongensis]
MAAQPTSASWYADFFTHLPNAFWRAAVPPERTEAEAGFVAEVCGLRPGARVLDVACGSGRHALELAARGYRVTGIDVSQEAIGYARARAAERDLDLDLRVGDMADLPAALPAGLSADAAICMGNAFGYLEHEATRRSLAGLARIVAPGGALVLDYGFAAESMLPGVSLEEQPLTIGGIEAVQVNEYDVMGGRWITAFTFRRGDEVHRGTSVQHVYTAAEVARLVIAAGFGGVEMYAGTDRAPYRLGSPRLLLVARK